MKKLYVLILINLWVINFSAQTFSWAKREGLWAYDYGYGIANDNAGNVYVAGKYEQNAKFSGVTLPCQGNHDIYVAKYNPAGALVWIRTAGGYTGDYARGLACDGSYVYVVGEIEGAGAVIKFIGSPITLTSKGNNDIVVAKYDLNGNLIWAKRAGDSYNDKGYGVTYDQYGNVYICGFFEQKAVFGNITLYGYGGHDVFVAKLDKNGNFLWAKRAGSYNTDEAKSIKCDAAGNVYVCGMYKNGAVFDNQTLYAPDGSYNAFIAKYSTNGTLLWIKNPGGSWDDLAWGLTIDKFGKIIVAGEFNSNIKFGSIQLNTTGAADVFVAAYDGAGNAVWAKKAGGNKVDRARGIGTDGSQIFITGQFGGTAYFGPASKTAVDNSDIFISCLNNNGQFLWTSTVGGPYDTQEDLGYESGNAICAEPTGNVYATGAILNGGTFGSTSVGPYSRTDVFITKLKNNFVGRASDELLTDNSEPLLDASIVGRTVTLSWLAPADTNYYTVEKSYDAVNFEAIASPADLSGSYSFIDSVHEDNALKVYYRLLQANASGEQSYSQVKELRIEPDNGNLTFKIFPNPAQDVLNISFEPSENQQEQIFTTVLYDISGKEIKRSEIVYGQSIIDISALSSGTYFIEIRNGAQVAYKNKVIRQ